MSLDISAPDCEIHNEESVVFHLFLHRDSPIFYFHLTPKIQGIISIIVKLYQEIDLLLGSTRVQTMAYEKAVGVVQLEVNSEGIVSPLSVYSDDYIKFLRQQMVNFSRRLQKLREIHALKGIDTEPHYLIEIEDIEEKLAELHKHTNRLDFKHSH